MIDGLLFREAPFRTEGPKGYLLRLSEANRLRIHDCEEMGVAFDTVSLEAHHLLPDRRLDPDLWAWVNRISRIKKETARVWNLNHSRFCPLCLQEDASWRAEWEVHFFDACPLHGTWMIDRCTSCEKLLTWKRGELVRCACGSDLRKEEPHEAPAEIVELSKTLAAKLKETDAKEGVAPTNLMNVDELQRLIRYLGVHLDHLREKTVRKLSNPTRMEASWPISSIAAAILSDWPAALHSRFSEAQAQSLGRKAGLPKTFERAYQYPYRALKGPSFEPVRDALEVWVAENWRQGISQRNRRISEQLRESARWVSASNEARRLGIRESRLRQLWREGAINGVETTSPSGRHFFMVLREQIDSLTEMDLHEVNMTTAMEQLGLCKKRMRELLKLLFPAAYRPTGKLLAPWRINRADVDQFLDIGRGLPEVSIPEESDVSFQHVLKYWTWTEREIIDLIEAVRDGKMKLTSLGTFAPGFARWIFNQQNLKLWKQQHSPESANWLSVPTAAKMLGLKQEVAYWLVRNEFLHWVPLHTRRGCGAQVKRTELEHFKATYVFATEIATLLNTSSKKLRVLLAEQDIHPLSDRVSGEKGGKMFYRRTAKLTEFLASLNVSIAP